MYDGIIFDQDGVLLDSGIDNFHWMEKIRIKEAQKNGIDLDANEVRILVHSSSHQKVEELLERKGMSWKQLEDIERKKENQKIKRIEKGDIKLFPKVKEVLQKLEQPTGMVTNAPYLSTKFTVNYFGIKDYFGHINAPKLDDMKQFYNRKKPKPVMIHETMEKLGMKNPIMIGDSGSDIRAAENAGIASIHLDSYGFETEVKPTHTADTVREILDIVKQETKTSDTV